MSPNKYPPQASRIQSLINAGRFIENPIAIIDQAVESFGSTYTFFMGGVQKAVLTTDPKAARHILQKNHKAYEKSEIVTDILGKYVGQGLLTATGDYWLRQRRLIQPGFQKQRIEALRLLMKTEVDRCMRGWTEKAKLQESFDAYEEMNHLTFRIVASTLFSSSLEEHGLLQLSELISTLQSFIIREIRQPYKRWWLQISGQVRKHRDMAAGARQIILAVIQERRNQKDQPDDLLTMLLDSRYEDTGEGMDDETLIDECLIMFVAGHETSANALSWMIYLLGKHPEEVDRVKHANEENKSTFIRNIVFETLRLYPPGWIVDRISKSVDQVLDYTLPSETTWVIYIRGMHRNPQYWDQPDHFIPERWTNPDLNKEAYMPFGAGPRLCIGEHFAMMEMELIMSEILRLWNIELLVDVVHEKPLVTLRPQERVLISIHPINASRDNG
jgi:cytochrome P450